MYTRGMGEVFLHLPLYTLRVVLALSVVPEQPQAGATAYIALTLPYWLYQAGNKVLRSH